MNSNSRTTRTLRLRLTDKHSAFLREQAREVNFVWNYCNETSFKIRQREGRFCSNIDLDKLTAGATKEGLSLHSQTVQAISKEYVTRGRQFKRAKLRWRACRGSRRSLGWVPFKASAIRYKAGQVWYRGRPLSLWDSYGLAGYKLGTGSFSEDSRGRWYLNLNVPVTVELAKPEPDQVGTAGTALGLDLGLKDLLVTSQGEKVQAQRFYRGLEKSLAVAQRAGKKQRVKAMHAKISNRRKDALHQLSTRLVKQHGAIFVGNVNAGVWFEVVNEAYTTQSCAACSARSGPKGLKGLGIRGWICSECATVHDRDVNAARDILARGLASCRRNADLARRGG